MINRDLLRTLRGEMDVAFRTIGQKHGLSIKTGNGSFSPVSAVFKVNIVALNGKLSSAGVPETREAADFLRYAGSAHLPNFQKEDLGKKIMIRWSNGEMREVKIVGFGSRSYKFPILCETRSGKLYKFPTDRILNALGRKL